MFDSIRGLCTLRVLIVKDDLVFYAISINYGLAISIVRKQDKPSNMHKLNAKNESNTTGPSTESLHCSLDSIASLLHNSSSLSVNGPSGSPSHRLPQSASLQLHMAARAHSNASHTCLAEAGDGAALGDFLLRLPTAAGEQRQRLS